MNVRSVASVVLLVVAVAAVGFGGIVLLFSGVGLPYSYSSYYEYDGTIATNGTLTNVTLYLPVPMSDGVVATDAVNVTVTTEGGAADWDVAVVDTTQGPMLAVTADRVEGELYYLVHEFDENGTHIGWEKVPEDELPANMTNKKAYPESTYYWFSVTTWLDDERIDVTDPVGNATVLRPLGNVTADACSPQWESDEDAACATFESAAYLQYTTAPDNVVRVDVSVNGVNEWGRAMSNGFNEFIQEAEYRATGSQDGWVTLDGRLYTDRGGQLP